jgi:hypothetical protein
MLSNALKITCALLLCAALLTQAGCSVCCPPKKVVAVVPPPPAPRNPCEEQGANDMTVLPANAKPGECYAKVWVPPTFRTVTERIKVRDASETVEVIPAKYEWVEEKILVKDASTVLEPVPAQFAEGQQTIQTNPGDTDWEVNKNVHCPVPKGQPARDVFCLVKHPPQHETVRTVNQVQPASVREVPVPAQYDTVRRQKLVSAATTRRIPIPAEYKDVEKTVKVCPGRMAWKLIDCDDAKAESTAADASESSNTASGSSKTATVNASRANRR